MTHGIVQNIKCSRYLRNSKVHVNEKYVVIMVSHRCGIMIGKCPFKYSLKELDSMCSLYSDRRECQKSMRQRKKSARHSRITNKTRKFDPRYI